MSKDAPVSVDPVPSTDPPVDEASNKKKSLNKPSDSEIAADDELSEEDLTLKNELIMLVGRLQDSDVSLYAPTLETLCTLMRTSTSLMTSVPKPLKFLLPHFETLKSLYDAWPAATPKTLLADVISVLAMSSSKNERRDCLKFRLLGTPERITNWGHEYLRHLAAEIGDEYEGLVESKQPVEPLIKLALELTPFFLRHNAEADAVDLLLELECIDEIVPFVDENTFARVCLYMVSCASYLPPPDDISFLRTARIIYRKVNRIPEALITSIRMGDINLMEDDFISCKDPLLKMQLAYILARQNIVFTTDVSPDLQEIMFNTKLSEHFLALGRELAISEPKTLEDIYKSHLDPRSQVPVDSSKLNLASTFVNCFVNSAFCKDTLMLADDSQWIFKTKDHMLQSSTASIGLLMLWDVEAGLTKIDRYLYNNDQNIQAGALLAVGIVHAGVKDESDPALAILSEHVYNSEKNLNQIMAIIGLSFAYAGTNRDVLNQILLPYLSDLSELSCFAALALGIINVGSGNSDISSAILQILLEIPSTFTPEAATTTSTTTGTPTATSNATAEPTLPATTDVQMNLSPDDPGPDSQLLPGNVDAPQLPFVTPPNPTNNILANETASSPTTTSNQTTTQNNDPQQSSADASQTPAPSVFEAYPYTRFMALGLGLLFVGHQDDVDPTLETIRAISNAAEPAIQSLLKMFLLLADVCAFAGTGNVLKVQSMLQLCTENLKENNEWQAMAVIGVALIAMGDDVGSEMAIRVFSHLFQYGEPVVRRNVPLALALLCASNPSISIMDTLSKYSHDNDTEVAIRAIFAMGVMGAGTNNARLAQMLRQLSIYYSRVSDCLFIVRIAQGLIHLGKGTMTLNPYHTNRTLMSRVGVSGLLAVLVGMTQAKQLISGHLHWVFYYLVNAMYPRFLITLDENRKPVTLSARVGQAVDVVGQAGRPKTITGFQTHNTPVLLAHGDRAELATDEYVPISPVLEGFVIVKKNPEHIAETKD